MLPSERWDLQHRKVLVWSLTLSVILHALLFVGWRTTASGSPGGPAEPRAAPSLVFGGGALEAISLAAPRAFEIPRPPEPAELTEEPVVEVGASEEHLIGD